MTRVSNSWTYEQEMSDREERRVLHGDTNQCAILGNPDFTGRLCPADEVSQCDDCPFKNIPDVSETPATGEIEF